MQRHRQPHRGRGGRAWCDGGAYNVQHTHDDAFGPQVPAKQVVAPMAIAGGSHCGWCPRTECMTLGMCERCKGIDNRSEGVVDVLGAMVERGERAAHAR